MRRVLPILCLLLLPAATMAQNRRFEITPTAGYRFDGSFNANSDLFDRHLDVQIDQSPVFGAIVDLPLSGGWQLELMANRQNSSFIVDDGLFEPERKLGDVTLDYVHGGLLYQWGPGQVNGFVVGTLGLTRIDPDFPEVEAENRFSASLGGGVKIFLAPNFGLRLEGRGYWTDLQTRVRRRDDRFDSNEGLYQGEAAAGFIFVF